MKYYSQVTEVEAIQFKPDGSNYDEVIAIVGLNKGHAELAYLNKDGSAAPRGTITAYKAIALLTSPGGPYVPVLPGYFVILNAQEEMYAVPEDLFKLYHVINPDDITVAGITFGDLRQEVAKFHPPLASVIVADKEEVEDNARAGRFLKEFGLAYEDSDGEEYYVINGKVCIIRNEGTV